MPSISLHSREVRPVHEIVTLYPVAEFPAWQASPWCFSLDNDSYAVFSRGFVTRSSRIRVCVAFKYGRLTTAMASVLRFSAKDSGPVIESFYRYDHSYVSNRRRKSVEFHLFRSPSKKWSDRDMVQWITRGDQVVWHGLKAFSAISGGKEGVLEGHFLYPKETAKVRLQFKYFYRWRLHVRRAAVRYATAVCCFLTAHEPGLGDLVASYVG